MFHPDSGIQVGDYVRLMTLESPIIDSSGNAIAIQNTENNYFISKYKCYRYPLVVTDADLDFYLNGGFIKLKKF
jgi:hypothetical protein